jgi:3-methyladenine DNA glycosylase AlkD
LQIIDYAKSGESYDDILEIFEDEATVQEIASLFQIYSKNKKSENKIELDIIEDIKPTKSSKSNFIQVKEPVDLCSVVNSIREEVEADRLMKKKENIRDELALIEIASKISKLTESEKALNLYQSLETHIYYYMNLQLEPKEIRALIMKNFELSSEQTDKVLFLFLFTF